MSRRTVKQIIYGALYLALIVLVGWWIYAANFKPAPSCFDNIQNQGEEGVDCGGPCAKVCTPATLRSISVATPLVFAEGEGVSAIAELRNPNTDYAVKSFNYTFNFYGDSDTVVQSVSGASFIYADEIKYLTAVNVPTGGVHVARVALSLQSPVWVSARDFAKPQFVSQGASTLVTSDGGVRVEGSFMNNDTVPFPHVSVLAVFGNNFGTAGISETVVDNVMPGGSVPFVILHPAITNIDPSKTQVYFTAPHP